MYSHEEIYKNPTTEANVSCYPAWGDGPRHLKMVSCQCHSQSPLSCGTVYSLRQGSRNRWLESWGFCIFPHGCATVSPFALFQQVSFCNESSQLGFVVDFCDSRNSHRGPKCLPVFHCANNGSVFVMAWIILLLGKVELQNFPTNFADRGCWVADGKSFGMDDQGMHSGVIASLLPVDARFSRRLPPRMVIACF